MSKIKKYETNSIDAIIANTELNKSYYDKEDCLELFRVVKPGANVLLFVETNIQDIMGCNARLAGFDVRDSIVLPGLKTNIIMLRKPLSEKTVVNNVIKWGTGGINIDISRVGTEVIPAQKSGSSSRAFQSSETTTANGMTNGSTGRFPANLILSHNEYCINKCVEGCPVKELDEQSGVSKSVSGGRSTGRNFGQDFEDDSQKDRERTGHNDTGGASRFFYVAKNNKQLLKYLKNLITPVNGKCIITK